MKYVCMVAALATLVAGCASTELSEAEKQASASYAEGYAPTGTMIKRKTKDGSNVVVVDKQQLENSRDMSGGEPARR